MTTYLEVRNKEFVKMWNSVYDLSVSIFDCSLHYNYLQLDCILIEPNKQKQGIGTNSLLLLIEYAQAYSLPIYLMPSDLYGTEVAILEKWYQKFGFSYTHKRISNVPFELRYYLQRMPQR
jgi:GNAT superfamily N-acetyltransferase